MEILKAESINNNFNNTHFLKNFLISNQNLFSKFKYSLLKNKINDENNIKNKFDFDNLYFNTNYFHINYIRKQLESGKKIGLVFEKDFVEKIQPNKIIGNTNLISFYFLYLHNNIMDIEENKHNNFENFNKFILFFNKNKNFFMDKYSKLYGNDNLNNLLNLDVVKKYNESFVESAKIFLFYNIFIMKHKLNKELLLKLYYDRFQYENLSIEPNNIFMSEIMEMKKKFKENFHIFNYFEVDKIIQNNKENDFADFTKNFSHNENKSILQVILKNNIARIIKNSPQESIITINTENITVFRKFFDTQKIFFIKNFKRRAIGKNELILKYCSKHLNNKIENENIYSFEPFMVKYLNQQFLFGEKIKVEVNNGSRKNILEDENKKYEMNYDKNYGTRDLFKHHIHRGYIYFKEKSDLIDNYFLDVFYRITKLEKNEKFNKKREKSKIQMKLNKDYFYNHYTFILFYTDKTEFDNHIDNFIDSTNIPQVNQKSIEFTNFPRAVDNLALYKDIDKKFLRYLIIRYGLENTEYFLENFNNKSKKENVLSKIYGITEEQIKFEIQHLHLKNPLDFLLKRHNYLKLLDKDNSLELYNVLECILLNLKYSDIDLIFELYKINLISNLIKNFGLSTDKLNAIQFEQYI